MQHHSIMGIGAALLEGIAARDTPPLPNDSERREDTGSASPVPPPPPPPVPPCPPVPPRPPPVQVPVGLGRSSGLPVGLQVAGGGEGGGGEREARG
jgi:hypothetical protein